MIFYVRPQQGKMSHGSVHQCYLTSRTDTVYAPGRRLLASRCNASFLGSSRLTDIICWWNTSVVDNTVILVNIICWWNTLVVDKTVILGNHRGTERRLINRDLVALTC